MKCPCHSGKLYSECCQPYHQGEAPQNALILMRSRYCAYALHLVDYIIETTHPSNPTAFKDKAAWKNQILEFSKNTQFQNLEILDWQEKNPVAFVTFKAVLNQGGHDVSFTEKSEFRLDNGKWTYIGLCAIR